MSRVKKLPKGLLEFEGSLHDLKYTPELLRRLKDLPKSDFRKGIREFHKAYRIAAEAESAAIDARNKAREEAMKIWNEAKANWTIKQLQEATGYDDE